MSSFYNFDNNTVDNFHDKDYSEIDNRTEIIEDVLKINTQGTPLKEKSDKTKLTHKDCLLLYLNPNIGSNNKLDIAIKHVKNCDTCKKELSKNKINDNISLSDSQINKKKMEKENKTIQTFSNILPTNQTATPISPQIVNNDDYKQILLDEKNIKYQNMLIENTMSKFLENNDEKKKLNDNIEKILQYLLKKDIQENSILPKYINPPNVQSDFTVIYVCLIILIILIIIDIVLRLK